MTFEEAQRCVGRAVIYEPKPDAPGRPGTIEAVKQLVVVRFHDHDGGILQVNPHCLRLAEPDQDAFVLDEPQLDFGG